MRKYFNMSLGWISNSQTVQMPPHLPRLLLAKRNQPKYARQCVITQEIKAKLELLNWELLPVTLGNSVTGYRTISICAYVGAYLVKIEYQLSTFGQLHHYLRSHPGLVWGLGFPLVADKESEYGFNIEKSLPTQRHLARKLSELPNEVLSNLLDGQIDWLKENCDASFGQTVSIDTKHIIAWVKENNPKQFVENRYDKEVQPEGDPDCKLGCKRRKNQTSPTKEGKPASEKASVGEYYWGYASGAVVTKIADVGEFVLAEMTNTFDRADITYFLPLMAQVESRLGFRPKYGTADAAFDAFYTHDYFYNEDHDGFAAIPLRNMGHDKKFNEDGVLLCEAGLPMYLKGKFTSHTSGVKHQKSRYGCPLLLPEKTAVECPIGHSRWEDGGCVSTMPSCPGARIRYQLDRESDQYKEIYAQRTAVERIFAQAVHLGIERPKLRNRRAIANYNTLIYISINLRAMFAFAD